MNRDGYILSEGNEVKIPGAVLVEEVLALGTEGEDYKE